MKSIELFWFLFFTFLGSTTTTADAKPNSLISQACNKSSHTDPNVNYRFCTTSLQSAPDSSHADLRKLGMIAFRLSKFNATNTRVHIRELLKNKKLDTYVKACLNDCYELYSDAMYTVRHAATDYGAKRYNDANIKISSVMDDAETCEQGFTDKKGVKSPLTKQNKELFELCAIALSMIVMVQ